MLLPANEQLFANAGHLPANTTLQPTDPIAQSFAALMPKGFARPTLKQLDNYWGNFGNALVAVIDKGTDPTKAVADACTAMDKANNLSNLAAHVVEGTPVGAPGVRLPPRASCRSRR
jgi:maltose-binding protein MalE